MSTEVTIAAPKILSRTRVGIGMGMVGVGMGMGMGMEMAFSLRKKSTDPVQDTQR